MDNQHPLNPLVQAWLGMIDRAVEAKKDFDADAEEAMNFFDGDHAFMWKDSYAKSESGFLDKHGRAPPSFRMQVNKIFECVKLFGPVLYSQNPVRTATLREQVTLPPELLGLPDPAMDPTGQAALYAQFMQQQEGMRNLLREARGKVMECYLNYTPNETDAKSHFRMAIDEAIIKGMGTLWCLSGGTEVYARFEGSRHSVVRVRDLHRANNPVELWDGWKWVHVNGMRVKPRSGDEIGIRLRSGEIINCTRDHRWPTDRGVVMASELVVGDNLQRCVLPEGNTVNPPLLPDQDIGWLVGLYVAEGNIHADKRDVRFGIAGHVDETERHERLESIVQKYGGAISWTTPEGTLKRDATISSRVLVAALREYVLGDGAYSKHLSGNCWNRSNVFLESLLEGYLAGDGHYVEPERLWRLHFCANHDLADDIRTVCARLGKILSLKLAKERSGEKEHNVYRGSIRTDATRINNGKSREEIVELAPADWRCDMFYDISVDSEPHLFSLASGILTHNCELYDSPVSDRKITGSFYDSCDNYLKDPDAKISADVRWIARRCVLPVWEWEDKYGYPRGYLKEFANVESAAAQGQSKADKGDRYKRATGQTNDMLLGWKIWTTMGIGGRLKNNVREDKFDLGPLTEHLEDFGDKCYIVVAKGVPHPLNMRPDTFDLEMDIDPTTGKERLPSELFLSVQWPIPLWADRAWPVTEIAYHRKPNQLWPISHLKPGIGEIRFLNWAMSFLATKISTTAETIIGVAKSAAKSVKEQLLEHTYCGIKVLELEEATGRKLEEIISVFDMPGVTNDMWHICEAVAASLDKRLGTTELMYAMSSRQMRSAEEANVKREMLNIRPDDMANITEDALSQCARKEALAAEWLLRGEDVTYIVGPQAAQFWDQHISSADLDVTGREYDYRIEAGSARKPNKDRDIANANQMVQTWGPVCQAYAAGTNNYDPLNALAGVYASATDSPPLVFTAPQPPPQPQPEPQPEAQLPPPQA